MDHSSQRGDYPYNSHKYGTATSNNGATDAVMGEGDFPTNTASAPPVRQNNDIDFKLDDQGLGTAMLDSNPSTTSRLNTGGQVGSSIGPLRVPSRGITTQYPYARPQSRNIQSQSQSQPGTHQGLSCGSPARDMSLRNSTNAYTLPRRRPSLAQSKTSRGLSSSSIKAAPDQEPGFVKATPLPASAQFVRPIHHKLDSSRIDPAGPETHPNPNWRAPGSHQWVEILHNYSLLQYLSDATIKDLLKHCDRLVGSGVRDSASSLGPALVEGGPYTVLDAQAVWNYCTAYTKRRQQHRNNSAASRSRNNKAAQLKHWKALALAAGAPDREFVFDINDEGNAPSAPPTLLAAVTQTAIGDMKRTWNSTAQIGTHASSLSLPPPSFDNGLVHQPLNASRTQQQVFVPNTAIAPELRSGVPLLGRNDTSRLVTMAQDEALTMPASGLPINDSVVNTYPSNDVLGELKLDMVPFDLELLKDYDAANTQSSYSALFNFGDDTGDF